MSLLFPSLLDEALFWVVFLAILVGLLWIEGFGARRFGERMGESDRRKYLAGTLSVLFLPGIFVWIGYARIGVLPDWLYFPGLALMIVGYVFTLWAFSILGRYFAPIARVRSDHVVIQKGPYRFIRHPMYTGQVLFFIGFGMALQSWVALLVILILTGILYTARIRSEEKLLVAKLGNEYVEYMKRTKRIIPFLL